jgi:hypothetical protein
MGAGRTELQKSLMTDTLRESLVTNGPSWTDIGWGFWSWLVVL